MSIADRIASWFGYVPEDDYHDVCDELDLMYRKYCPGAYSEGERGAVCNAICPDVGWCAEHGCGRATRTTTNAHIIVSADFKRGIPCS